MEINEQLLYEDYGFDGEVFERVHGFRRNSVIRDGNRHSREYKIHRPIGDSPPSKVYIALLEVGISAADLPSIDRELIEYAFELAHERVRPDLIIEDLVGAGLELHEAIALYRAAKKNARGFVTMHEL